MLFNEPKLLKSAGVADEPLDADSVSVLFNEPKLLKSLSSVSQTQRSASFSALQRAEIAEIPNRNPVGRDENEVSVLFNEPKLLK